MSRKFSSLLCLAVAFVTLAVAPVYCPGFAQEKLEDAKTLLEKAKAAQADLLSPDTYADAEKAYNEAVKKTEKGASLDQIRKLISDAAGLSNTAIRNTDLAKVTFVDVLPARQKALDAQAPTLSKEAWREADAKFYDAASALEHGNANDAKKKGVEARDLFLTAELLAIKEDIIGETGRYIQQLEDEDVGKYAPVTLDKAKQHLRKAEETLNKDRYRKEDARALDTVAQYEAEHARDLANRIQKDEKGKVSQENLYLGFEDDLMVLGKTAGVSLQFNHGIQSQVDLLKNAIAAQKEEADSMRTELEDLRKKYAGSRENVVTIDEQLRQQRVKKERLDRVTALFGEDEAKILQDGSNVIIRCTGFTFPSGTAVIEPRFFNLLTKVQKAISEFPSSHITVEGNTDSMGEDNYNLQLSQKRADAIRTYLVANLGINPERIVAVGYGESKPIASNETEKGRAQNRRVDIVIEPQD